MIVVNTPPSTSITTIVFYLYPLVLFAPLLTAMLVGSIATAVRAVCRSACPSVAVAWACAYNYGVHTLVIITREVGAIGVSVVPRGIAPVRVIAIIKAVVVARIIAIPRLPSTPSPARSVPSPQVGLVPVRVEVIVIVVVVDDYARALAMEAFEATAVVAFPIAPALVALLCSAGIELGVCFYQEAIFAAKYAIIGVYLSATLLCL